MSKEHSPENNGQNYKSDQNTTDCINHYNSDERYITETHLEEITHRSKKSWQRDRIKGGGIPFIRCGGKILYDMRDVEDYMNANKHTSTSAYAGANK